MELDQTTLSLVTIAVTTIGWFYTNNKQNDIRIEQKKLSFELLFKPRYLSEVDKFRDWIIQGFMNSI
jgi:hypothetical protein